jgi:transposase
MSLKPSDPQPIPKEIAAWGNDHLPKASPYRLLGDTLFELYRDEDFADLYHVEGRPATSPVLLSFVLVLQALEDESDRGAADAVLSNLKWKYALHLPLDYAGFDFSILCDFRDRLIQHKAEARIFDTILTHLKALGLLTSRGIQRTDSLSVHTKARDLSRIELMTDTIRVVVRALLRTDPDWTRATVPVAWDERYGQRLRVERMDKAEKEQLSVVAGDDGAWLLDQIDAEKTPEAIKNHVVVALLRTIWQQHYAKGDDGHMH